MLLARRIKIRAEINEIKTKKRIQRINISKSWFFESIDNQQTSGLANQKEERTQIHRIRNEQGIITTDTCRKEKPKHYKKIL